MNSETLDSTRDIGNDGKPGNINGNFASDAFGYSLNYYNGDYSAIDNNRNNCMAGKTNIPNFADNAPNLYNGNISSMVTTITNPTSLQKLAQLTAYRYDQLNRIMQMRAYGDINIPANAWGSSAWTDMFKNTFAYDAMGNMKTATANNQAGVAIDNQDYRYQTVNGQKINNRLYAINDSATTTSNNDLLDQLAFDNTASTINTANNYSYNEIGELKANKQDSIESIEWTVYGKIKSVTRTSGCHKYNLAFDYDPNNKRIAKHVYNNGDTLLYSEYYIRDATGNLLSTYKYVIDQDLQTASYKQTEEHIYGSSAIGIDKTETELLSAPPLGSTYTHTLGNKQFSGSNHLGNTLVIFTDKKIAHDDDNNGTIDYYTAEIVAANDYAPFGGLLTERTFNKGEFPNSFNGKRDDPELGDWQDYGERMYSPSGREFPTPDPLSKRTSFETPYMFAGNNPIYMIDKEGEAKTTYITTIIDGKKTTIKVVDDKYTLPVYKRYIPDEGSHVINYTVDYNVVEFITIDVDNNKILTTGEQTTNPAWENNFEWLIDSKKSRPGGNSLVGDIDIPANDAKYLPTAKNPGKDIDITPLFGIRGGASNSLGDIVRTGSQNLGLLVDVMVKGFKLGQKLGDVLNMVGDAINKPKPKDVYCTDCTETFQGTSSGRAGNPVKNDKKTPKDTINRDNPKHPE